MPNDHFAHHPAVDRNAKPVEQRAIDMLLNDFAQQAPLLLQRMELNLPLPRPTLKLIRTLTRLAARDGRSSPAASS